MKEKEVIVKIRCPEGSQMPTSYELFRRLHGTRNEGGNVGINGVIARLVKIHGIEGGKETDRVIFEVQMEEIIDPEDDKERKVVTDLNKRFWKNYEDGK